MPRRDPFTAMCQQLAAQDPTVIADLHAHTTASDGDDTPSRFVVRAIQEKLTAIAITDHDTLAGIPEAIKIAKQMTGRSIEIVPGIELSTTWNETEYHLLGLWVDYENAALKQAAADICASRHERFLAYVSGLNSLNFVIPAHRVESTIAISSSLGRRHVVQLLKEAGYQNSRHSFFSEILPSVQAQVPRKKLLPIAEAIELIHHAGGLAILAHPPAIFDLQHFQKLKVYQLDGMEYHYPNCTATQSDFILSIAKELGMICSAGSDFHGYNNFNKQTVGRIGLSRSEYSVLKQIAGQANRPVYG